MRAGKSPVALMVINKMSGDFVKTFKAGGNAVKFPNRLLFSEIPRLLIIFAVLGVAIQNVGTLFFHRIAAKNPPIAPGPRMATVLTSRELVDKLFIKLILPRMHVKHFFVYIRAPTGFFR